MLAYMPVFLEIPFISEAIDKVEQFFIGTPTKSILQDAFSDNVLSNLANFIKLSNKSYDTAFGKAQLVFNVTKPIGFAFIMTFFMIYLMGIVSRDALTLETFVKSLIALVIVFALANASDKIIKTTLTVADVAVNKTTSTLGIGAENGDLKGKVLTGNDKQKKKQKAALKTAGANLVRQHHSGAIVIALVVWVIAKISQVGMYISVISRAIELLWRTILMPIGIANSFGDVSSSPGVRFIKQYLAVALSGVLIIFIVYIGQQLAIGILEASKSPGIGTCLLACAALMSSAGAAMTSTAKIKEVFG